MRAAAFVIAAFVLSGCHTYRTVPSGALPDDSQARVYLTDRGTEDLARFVGPYSRALAGGVLSKSDSALALSVAEVERFDGNEEFWRGERVVVPRDAIASVQVRRISPIRTALLSTGLVAAAFVLGKAFAGDVFGGGGEEPRPSPQ
jgi:hypothetical protein